MIDVLVLWTLLVTLLLGPVPSQGVAIDIVDAASDRVVTMTARASDDGFVFEAVANGVTRVVLRARRVPDTKATYDLQLEGESQKDRVDLAPVLAAVGDDAAGAGDAPRTHEGEGRRVSVTARGALRYVVARPTDEPDAPPRVCVRRPLD